MKIESIRLQKIRKSTRLNQQRRKKGKRFGEIELKKTKKEKD
jgi:hypothetical protein